MSHWRRILCVVLLSLMAAACQTELYRGLNQRDANEMTAVLARHGVQVVREQTDATTYRLMVPNEQLYRSVDILKRLGYPRETFQSLGEVFKGEGLIVSPFEQRVRMMHALNQELSRTISAIDGVVTTRVHVVVPELDLRGAPMTKPTASVVVHHRSGVDTGELSAKIRLTVANGVQGLAYKDVSLAFFEAPFGGARSTGSESAYGSAGGSYSGGSSSFDTAISNMGMPNTGIPNTIGSSGTSSSSSGAGGMMGNLRGSLPTAQTTSGNPSGDPLSFDTQDKSILSLVRTWVAMILWGLAVMMALTGVVFVILNSMGKTPFARKVKKEADNLAV
jgi:type III secretion system YscJ/HrcJ family lipoprotein